MLEELYIITFVIGILLLFIGLTNAFKLVRSTRMLVMFLALLVFLITMFSGFNIEKTYCGSVITSINTTVANISSYTNGWSCVTQPYQDLIFIVLNIVFFIISLLYLIVEAMGWMPG